MKIVKSILFLVFFAAFWCKSQDLVIPVNACQNKYGEDSIETVKQLSLFNQYFQQKKYASAYPYWQYLFDNAPCVKKRITYNGSVVVKAKMVALKKENPELYKDRLKGLVDTVLMSHQYRISFFGKEGYVKGKWANDLAKLRPSERQKALQLFSESIELEGENTNYNVPTWYMQAATKAYKKGKIPIEQLISIFESVSEINQINLSKNNKYQSKWEKSISNVEALMKPHFTAEIIEEVFRPKIDSNENNIEMVKKVASYMEAVKGEKTDFFLELSEKIVNAEPSAQGYLSLAKAKESRNQAGEAKKYYLSALTLIDSAQMKANIYYKLAKYEAQSKNYSKSRKYCYDAIKINENMGKAYLLIGDLYAGSRALYSADKLGGAGVFIAAVNKYIQARQADADLTEKVNEKIAKYMAYYPCKKDAFFNGINAGDAFVLGGWISENIIVKTRDCN